MNEGNDSEGPGSAGNVRWTTRETPRPLHSSRVIPSAPRSPDDGSAHLTPSVGTRVVVWGGVALGVAGLTAAAVFAARRLAGPETGNASRRGSHGSASHRAAPVHRSAPSQGRAKADATHARKRDARKSRRDPALDLGRRADALSASLNGVVDTVLAAFGAFRNMSLQSSDIVDEFSRTADGLRSMLRGTQEDQRRDKNDSDPDNR